MDKKLGFETILAEVPNIILDNVSEENYCPDCYDCNLSCEECDNN